MEGEGADQSPTYYFPHYHVPRQDPTSAGRGYDYAKLVRFQGSQGTVDYKIPKKKFTYRTKIPH